MSDSSFAKRNMLLPNWDDRSWTAGNMLNPALLAVSLAATAYMYEQESGDAMPWELAFLSVPMVLHRDTREALPTRINSHLVKWVASHATLQASFADRARSTAPYTREGIRFALRNSALHFTPDGCLKGHVVWRTRKDRDPELQDIIGKSAFVGRWFAHTGPPATLYALLGVAP